MKTLLIIDSSQGQARGHLAQRMLSAAAAKAGLQLVDAPAEAELVVVAGAAVPADEALSGKAVYLGDVEHAVRDADAFLAQAKRDAAPYQAPAVAPAAAAATAATPAAGRNALWR
ncbi:PTS system fructose-specific transporter subunits IIBC [Serratia rubidaea]|uniref:PTS system fructose-specific transporter subunits IIBC n=1 Tax=Serratia rubidaea TaxID=61652 RepID=A0A3S4G866_SERRU|nr:PTS system fructose-specific transporter subunits IIBC [Serratia rubidaea]